MLLGTSAHKYVKVPAFTSLLMKAGVWDPLCGAGRSYPAEDLGRRREEWAGPALRGHGAPYTRVRAELTVASSHGAFVLAVVSMWIPSRGQAPPL